MVRVIMPTFNRLAYAIEAINSFLLQDFNGEKSLHVIDNGTNKTDSEILQGYCHNKDIIFERREVNVNPAIVCNQAAENAIKDGAQIITFHYDDDILPKDALTNRDYDIMMGNCDFTYSDYTIFGAIEKEMICGEVGLSDILKKDCVGISTIAFKADCWNNGNLKAYEDLWIQSDWAFKIKLFSQFVGKYVPISTCNYRAHPGQENKRFTKEQIKQETDIIFRRLRDEGVIKNDDNFEG